MSKNHLQEKWQEEEPKMDRVTNETLDCRDCKFRYDDTKVFGNTSRCEKYPEMKPAEVIYGGDCEEKEPE